VRVQAGRGERRPSITSATGGIDRHSGMAEGKGGVWCARGFRGRKPSDHQDARIGLQHSMESRNGEKSNWGRRSHDGAGAKLPWALTDVNLLSPCRRRLLLQVYGQGRRACLC
jgi:hypothetical protein